MADVSSSVDDIRQLHSKLVEACAASDWSRGIRLLEAAIEEREDEPMLYCNRAFCYSQLGLNKHAIKDCDAAIAIDPSCVQAYLRKALAQRSLNRSTEAASTLASGLSLAASSPSTDIELCLLLHSLSSSLSSSSPSPSPALSSSVLSSSQPSTSATPPPRPHPSSISSSPSHTSSAAASLPIGSARSANQSVASLATPSNGVLPLHPAAASSALLDKANGPNGAASPFALAISEAGPSAHPPSDSPPAASVRSPAGAVAASSSGTSPSLSHSSSSSSVAAAAEVAALATQMGGRSETAEGKDKTPKMLPDSGTKAASPAGSTKQKDGSLSGVVLSSSASGSTTTASSPSPSAASTAASAVNVAAAVVSAAAAAAAAAGGGSGRSHELLLSIGINQVNAGKLEEAISIFSRILSDSPSHVGALIGRGTAFALKRLLPAAVADFSKAVSIEPKAAEGWKRRAQARAALGEVQEALSDFARALELEPGSIDLLLEQSILLIKTRSFRPAIANLKRVISAQPENKIAHNYMGTALVGCGECIDGIRSFKRAVQIDPTFRDAWMGMGQAYRELADAAKTTETYEKVLALDKSFPAVYRLWALLKHGMGDHRGALQLSSQGLQLDPESVELNYIHSSCHHAVGDYAQAVREYDAMLGLDSESESRVLQYLAFYQREIAMYTATKLNAPLSKFNIDDDLDPFFKEAWCKKLPPTVLFPGYKGQPIGVLQSSMQRRKGGNSSSSSSSSSSLSSSPSSATRQRLVEAADRLGRRTQNSCPGFLPNVRQHRMAGLAIIDVMQLMSATWQSLIDRHHSASENGCTVHRERSCSQDSDESAVKSPPLMETVGSAPFQDSSPPSSTSAADTLASSEEEQNAEAATAPAAAAPADADAAAAAPPLPHPAAAAHAAPSTPAAAPATGSTAAARKKTKATLPLSPQRQRKLPAAAAVGWRDCFAVAVRWRQVSEPCDPVVWVDKLTESEFAAGFGSHTPMLLGQSRVVRYFANFKRSFRIMKQQLLSGTGVFNAKNEPLSFAEPEKRRLVEAAEDCADLWAVVGEDFWVLTPCYSIATPGKVLEGTRLTLVKSPTGFDFAIRTPGTPSRWADFDAELTAAWENLAAVVLGKPLGQSESSVASKGTKTVEEPSAYAEAVLNAVLRLAYFWYNFMPLCRGTAMVGHIGIIGLLLAANYEVTANIPKGLQVDWEAILSPRFETFRNSVSPWLLASLKENPPVRNVAKLSEVFPTLWSVVCALSSYGE